MVTPGAKRYLAMDAQATFGLSERRACDLVGATCRAAPVRLSPSGVSSGARGPHAQPQEAAAHLSRGGLAGAPMIIPRGPAGLRL